MTEMEWFGGTVTEAIRAVRNESRFLLVFVKGSDESSEQMDKQFDADTAAVCTGLVCLRLDASSEAAMQFSAVYVLLSVPCIYIIAPNGKAVDVKLGSIEKDELRDWITKHTKKESVPSCSTQNTNDPRVSSDSPQKEDLATSGQADAAPLDQRVSQAYKLMEEKRRARIEEEREKARTEEIQRRELGKSMQDFRERQRVREIQEAMDERRREEAESRKLRERLRQQIEEDRRAFQERSQVITNPSSTDPAPAPTERVLRQRSVPNDQPDLARLQLRLIGGCHVIGRFTPLSTLATDVRNWLQQAITNDAQDMDGAGEYPNIDEETRQKLSRVISQGYRFRQLHPPKLFEPEEESGTMVDLGLCPSAVLILVPNGGGSTRSIQSSSSGWGSTVYGLVSGSLGTLYSYASWLLGSVYSFGSGFVSSISPSHTPRPRSSPESTSQPAPTSSSPSETRESRAIRRQNPWKQQPVRSNMVSVDVEGTCDELETIPPNKTLPVSLYDALTALETLEIYILNNANMSNGSTDALLILRRKKKLESGS